jgi:nitroimidazol reductase NimA-like FMN-containing flavoprotein (pyridoxamine 5'-phosphate oxidase superfamily)
MRSVDAHSGIEVLHRDECLRLLEQDVIGRLAVVVGGAPTIFPVNYRVDGESIVFRSDPGTKVDIGPRARACFEIDHFDRERRTGWSVVVSGRLDEVTPYDGAALDRVRDLPIDPWAGGVKAHWMRLTGDRVTGRRVGGRD